MSARIDVVREGTEAGTNSQYDGAVLLAAQDVVAIESLQLAPASLIASLEGCLEQHFIGATSSAPVRSYKWVHCPEEIPAFKFVCCDKTVITVNDGGSKPILVTVEIGTPVP